METEERMAKYLKGTTTLGFVCKDGIVLASDSRATMGYLISDKEARKIYQIDENIALTTAGMVADNQMLVRIMKAQAALYKLQDKPMNVKAAATLLANILQSNKYFPYWVQLILGGYDSEGRVYELDAVGGIGEKNVSATGSGSPVAYGVLEQQYKEDLTVDEGKMVAVRAIKAALERDAATGNKINLVTITKGGYKEYSREEIDNLVKESKK